MTTSYDQCMDPIHEEHRWTRHADPDGRVNHFCVDGDTEHHDEPCEAAVNLTGEHENDPPGVKPESWPLAPSSWPFLPAT
jgi:hypothetical protein